MPDDMEVGWKPATDPLQKDTDGDGLSDWAELMVGSDPTKADTDGDGWRDGYEVCKGTDPTKAASIPSDADELSGADLENMREYMQTTSGTDTDHDGLSDEFERSIDTNPRVPDTDNDGLGDMVEWLRGTNPKSPGRIDPQSNYDLNRIETGKPLPLEERKDHPQWGPLGPKRSGKRADAGDGTDSDGDRAVATDDATSSAFAEPDTSAAMAADTTDFSDTTSFAAVDDTAVDPVGADDVIG
jgi:hypothetical protein